MDQLGKICQHQRKERLKIRVNFQGWKCYVLSERRYNSEKEPIKAPADVYKAGVEGGGGASLKKTVERSIKKQLNPSCCFFN